MIPKTILFTLLFTIGLIPANLPAQDTPCAKRTMAVGVVDNAWNLVPNLTTANFRGKLRGQEVQVLAAPIDRNPRRIVLLLDASGSMAKPGWQWETEKSVSEYLIRFGPARASIAEVAFAENVIDTEGFAQDPTTLMENLHGLLKVCERRKVLGRTALFDAILSARGLLGVPNPGDVICVLTDAGDNRSQTKVRKVGEELVNARIRVFAAVINHYVQDRQRLPDDVEGLKQLHSLVDVTGGNMLTLPLVITSPAGFYHDAKTREAALSLAVQRLCRQMGEFYGLDVRLPEAVDKPTEWKLEVVNADGKPMKGVEVHYPQELMPCAKASP